MTDSAVRAATRADAAEMVRLGEFMYVTVGMTVSPSWQISAIAQLEHRLDGGDLHGFVVDAGDRQLAACGVLNVTRQLPLPREHSGMRGHVQWVATDPAHQRQGHARAVMKEVMRVARELELENVTLLSSPMARGMYERLGFVCVPDVTYPPKTRGVPMQWRATSLGQGAS